MNKSNEVQRKQGKTPLHGKPLDEDGAICFDKGDEASSAAILDPTRPSTISPTPIRGVIEYCQKQIDANSDEVLLWLQCKSLAQKALEPVDFTTPSPFATASELQERLDCACDSADILRNYKAHAEALAEALRDLCDNGGSIKTWKAANAALAKWEAAK